MEGKRVQKMVTSILRSSNSDHFGAVRCVWFGCQRITGGRYAPTMCMCSSAGSLWASGPPTVLHMTAP